MTDPENTRVLSGARPASRRALLGGTIGLATLGTAAIAAVPTPPHPDAELIAACNTFDALEADFNALFCGTTCIHDDNAREPFIDRIIEAQKPSLARILSLQARTIDGLMARARTVFGEDKVALREALATIEKSPYVNERLMAAMTRDLAALAGVEVAA